MSIIRHFARKVSGCPFTEDVNVSIAWDDWDTVVDSTNGSNQDITTATIAIASIVGFPIHPAASYTVTTYNGNLSPGGVQVTGGNLILKVLRPEEVCSLQTAIVRMNIAGCPPVYITVDLITSDEFQSPCILIDTSYTCATNPPSGDYVDDFDIACEPCPNRQFDLVGVFDPFEHDTLFSEWWRSQQSDPINPPYDPFSNNVQMSGSGTGGIWARDGLVFAIGSFEETLRTVVVGGLPQLDYSLKIKDIDGTVMHNIVGYNNVDTGAGDINCGDDILIQLFSNDEEGVVSLGDMTILVTLN